MFWPHPKTPPTRVEASPSRKFIALLALALLAAPARASDYERQVLAALNVFRADPRAYADGLKRFRANFRGRLIHYPGQRVPLQTQEGVPPLDQTVGVLRGTGPLPSLRASGPLAEAARDHVVYQGPRGLVGHMQGRISPADRLRAHGGGGALTEVIAYGARDPADVIRQLLIDDGVPDRGHRTALLDPDLRHAGVACGPHRVYRTMCVIDLSPSWNGGGRLRLVDWVRARALSFRLPSAR